MKYFRIDKRTAIIFLLSISVFCVVFAKTQKNTYISRTNERTLDLKIKNNLIHLSEIGYLPASSCKCSQELVGIKQDIIPVLRNIYLKESSPELRRGAIIALGLFNDIRCFDALSGVFINSKLRTDRILALDILTKNWRIYGNEYISIRDKLGYTAFCELKRLDANTFYDALTIIEHTEYKNAEDFLFKCFMSEEINLKFRVSIGYVLATMKNEKFMILILGTSTCSLPPGLKKFRFRYLARTGTHSAVQLFIDTLNNGTNTEKRCAASSLWAFDYYVLYRYFYEFARLANDKDPVVKDRIVSSLNKIADLSEDPRMANFLENKKMRRHQESQDDGSGGRDVREYK